MKSALLGPEYDDAEIMGYLERVSAPAHRLSDSELSTNIAKLINDEKVIGWFNGRMEFGPRALGARSIIGDPRSPRMQSQMNLKIKYRESFRPFAPSVLREHVSEFFDLDADSPYMLLVAPVRQDRQIPMSDEQQNLFGIEQLNVPRSEIPAVTHVDYSARIQTLQNPNAAPNQYRMGPCNSVVFTLLTRRARKWTCCLTLVSRFQMVKWWPSSDHREPANQLF